MHNREYIGENETHKLLWDFEIQTKSPNLGQKTRHYNNKKRKEKKRKGNLPNCGCCYLSNLFK